MNKLGPVSKPVGGVTRSGGVQGQQRVRSDSGRAKPSAKTAQADTVAPVTSQKNRSSDNSLKTIGQRLAKVRRAAGVTQIKLANAMGTTQPSLARFEKDQALPNLRTVMRYASAMGLDISATLDDKKSSQGAVLMALEKLPVALAKLRKERGITQVQVAHRMQTTQPIIARFERGDATPNLTTLERYAKAIGFSLGLSLLENKT